MTNREAIERIKNHMHVHKIGEPPHLKIAEALYLALDLLEQPPSPVWTPCSEANPTDETKPYDATCEADVYGRKIRCLEVLRYSSISGWEKVDGIDYKVIAWRPRPEPYQGDQKADHIVDLNKKIEEAGE